MLVGSWRALARGLVFAASLVAPTLGLAQPQPQGAAHTAAPFAFQRLAIDQSGLQPVVCLRFTGALCGEGVRYSDYLAMAPDPRPGLRVEGQALCLTGLSYGSDYKIDLHQGLPGRLVGQAGKTPHQTNAQKQEMMMAETLADTKPPVILAQAPQRTTSPPNRQSPDAQLQSLVDGLGNGGIAYRHRIACMDGTIVPRKENNVGHFAGSPDITIGQACRALMEFSADATARGDNTPAELLAPFRELVDFSSTNPNPQRNQAAQRLVNGYVNGSRDPQNANTRGVLVRLDGENKTYPLTPGTALDARFSQVVLGVRNGSITTVPNRISTWSEAEVDNAVETCVRGNATLRQCTAIGQEVAAIYLARPRTQAQR